MSISCRNGVSKRRGRSRRATFVLGLVLVVLAHFGSAEAARLRDGEAALSAGSYAKAATIFLELAAQDNARAQAYLGYMYANGRGVPQNYLVAAQWYRCAGGQGYPPAAYMLGLLYDKGQGVPQDFVLAYTWLNLAVAGSGRQSYFHYWVNIRNAIASKLTLLERLKAQEMALIGPTPNVCEPLSPVF